jgi:hypothetical protein
MTCVGNLERLAPQYADSLLNTVGASALEHIEISHVCQDYVSGCELLPNLSVENWYVYFCYYDHMLRTSSSSLEVVPVSHGIPTHLAML